MVRGCVFFEFASISRDLPGQLKLPSFLPDSRSGAKVNDMVTVVLLSLEKLMAQQSQHSHIKFLRAQRTGHIAYYRTQEYQQKNLLCSKQSHSISTSALRTSFDGELYRISIITDRTENMEPE